MKNARPRPQSTVSSGLVDPVSDLAVVHPSRNVKKVTWLKIPAIVLLAVAVVMCLVGGYVRYFPVMTWNGWKSEVAYSDLYKVSALAIAANGKLYASQELRDGKGLIVELVAGAAPVTVVRDLSKPDGLAVLGADLIISQEGGDYPLLKFSPKPRLLTELPFRGRHIEQIWVHESEDGPLIYAIEDSAFGKLLMFDINAGSTTILAHGLVNAEGVSRCPDGRILFVGKASGTIYQLLAVHQFEAIVEGLENPGFVLCTDDGFWITEDSTNHSRVLFFENQPPYDRQVVATHLRAAQSLVELPDNSIHVSEQGRSRILRFYKED
jgi:hypothetical protein